MVVLITNTTIDTLYIAMLHLLTNHCSPCCAEKNPGVHQVNCSNVMYGTTSLMRI